MVRRPLESLLRPVVRRITRRNLALALALVATVVAARELAARYQGREDWHAALTAPGERLAAVAFTPDGRHVVAGCASGNVILWELPDGPPRALKPLSDQPVVALVAGTNGRIVAGGDSASLLQWSRILDPSATRAQAQQGFPAPIACVAVRIASPRIAVGMSDGSLALLGGEKPVAKRDAHRGGVRTAAFSPDGATLVTGGADGRLAWRNAETGDTIGTVDEFKADVGGAAFSPDGRVLVAGDWNGTLTWFDAATRKPLATAEQGDAVSGVAVTESTVVTGSWDGRLRVWSLASREKAAELRSHRPIGAMAVSADGATAATVSGDARVLLWKIPPAP